MVYLLLFTIGNFGVFGFLNLLYLDNKYRGKQNVEVATGTGVIAIEVAKVVSHVEAVDIAAKMIEEAQKKTCYEGLKNIPFSVQSAYSLNFDHGVFDTAICAMNCIG